MHAQRNLLDDGRWHFSHGPIDVLISAEGDADALAAAHRDAWMRFERLLDALVGELKVLRRPIAADCAVGGGLSGPVARRMWDACAPFAATTFITPMAAVAGAVAQELVVCYRRPGVARAWVNNGGDIALHLEPGQSASVGLFADLASFDVGRDAPIDTDAQFTVDAAHPVRGIATSGWRGRSFSLGIADSVTVLAPTASQADAAATVIANAVDADDTAIRRRPASECKDDSDLGDLRVTIDVPALAPDTVRGALDAGAACARALQQAGHVWAVALVCQGQWRRIEPLPAAASPYARLLRSGFFPEVHVP